MLRVLFCYIFHELILLSTTSSVRQSFKQEREKNKLQLKKSFIPLSISEFPLLASIRKLAAAFDLHRTPPSIRRVNTVAYATKRWFYLSVFDEMRVQIDFVSLILFVSSTRDMFAVRDLHFQRSLEPTSFASLFSSAIASASNTIRTLTP